MATGARGAKVFPCCAPHGHGQRSPSKVTLAAWPTPAESEVDGVLAFFELEVGSLRFMSPSGCRRHCAVMNFWLSVVQECSRVQIQLTL